MCQVWLVLDDGLRELPNTVESEDHPWYEGAIAHTFWEANQGVEDRGYWTRFNSVLRGASNILEHCNRCLSQTKVDLSDRPQLSPEKRFIWRTHLHSRF